jgi:hypothetical protein
MVASERLARLYSVSCRDAARTNLPVLAADPAVCADKSVRASRKRVFKLMSG